MLGGLLGVFVLALAVRLICLWQLRHLPTMLLPISDSGSYFEWSARIAAGDWWRGRVFYQAPLYAYLLALIRLLGGSPLPRMLVAQAVLGAFSCVLLAVAGSAFLGRRAGLVAGLLLALYAPAIFYEGVLQKTVLDTLFLSGLLACLARAQRSPRPGTWLAAGFLLGLLGLTRENALLLIVTLPVWVVLRFRDRPLARRAAWVATGALGLVLVLAPVAARNYAVGGRLVVTTYSLGTNLYIGNNPAARGHYLPLRPGREDPAFESLDAGELAEAARGRRLTPREVSDYWVERALLTIREQPARWLGLTATKAVLLLNGAEIIDAEDFGMRARHSSVLRGLGWLLGFSVLLPLAAVGIWLTWRDRSSLWLLHLVLLTLFAALLPFFVFGRYRFMLVPPLLLFAAAALVEAAERIRAGRSQSLIAPVAVAVAAAGVAWLPLVSRANQEAAASVNQGAAAARLGRLDEALAYEDRAIEFLPGLIQAHYQRATILQLKGDPEGARAAYERVLALDPTNEAARIDLGRLLEAQGHSAAACAQFEESLRANPNRAIAHASLAVSLAHLGRLSEAREHSERAIALEPENGAHYSLLGQVLLAAKDTLGAIRAVRRAIALEPGTPGAYELLARTLVARGEGAAVPALLDSARHAGQASGALCFRIARDLRQAGDVATALAILESCAREDAGNADVINALAWYLVTAPGQESRSATRALGLAREAVRLTGGKWPYALDTEAAAHAALGDYARAVETGSAASALARQQGDRALAEEIEGRVRLYRLGRPYVERR